jgi:hypothetical protein
MNTQKQGKSMKKPQIERAHPAVLGGAFREFIDLRMDTEQALFNARLVMGEILDYGGLLSSSSSQNQFMTGV